MYVHDANDSNQKINQFFIGNDSLLWCSILSEVTKMKSSTEQKIWVREFRITLYNCQHCQTDIIDIGRKIILFCWTNISVAK